jgi:hypothetical protein
MATPSSTLMEIAQDPDTPIAELEALFDHFDMCMEQYGYRMSGLEAIELCKMKRYARENLSLKCFGK